MWYLDYPSNYTLSRRQRKTSAASDTCPALYYDTVLRDSRSETRLLISTDFKGFSISMRRSEDLLPAASFLVDHSNVERLQKKHSGKKTQDIQPTSMLCQSAHRLIQQSMLNFSQRRHVPKQNNDELDTTLG